jgi:hypothetical protein
VDERGTAPAEGRPTGERLHEQVAELRAMVEQQAALLRAQAAALESHEATIAALEQRVDDLPPVAPTSWSTASATTSSNMDAGALAS